MAMNQDKNIWPGWETVRLIGRGSFGAVYEIQRDVFGETEKAALKVISIPQNSGEVEEMYNDGYDEESITSTFTAHLKSIVAEYSLMRKMKGCSNIVNCDDVRYVQHEDGIGWDIFIKMELLTPLAKTMPENVPESMVVQVARDLCAALESCARYNVVHRDVKPHNIFYSENGGYKLGDFGIAKTVERTMGGTKIGTYKYMAPEVFNNQPYGAAADIYSLGLVLYWMLNERRMPFMPLPPEKIRPGMDEHARFRRLSGEQLPPPANGSEGLKAIVLKACAYDAKDRFASAKEMLNALDSYQSVMLPLVDPEEQVPDPIIQEEEIDATVVILEEKPSGDGDVGDQKDWSEDFQEQDEEEATIRDPGTKSRQKAGKRKNKQKRRKYWLPMIAAVVLIAVGVLFVFKPWAGWRTIDGKIYYYTSDGKKQTGWGIIEGEIFYFDSEGIMKIGLQTIDGERFYFAGNGVMQTGWVTIGGEKCYFADDGAMQLRLVTKDGKTYGFNQRDLVQIGWKTLGGYKYYFDGEGAMQTGWGTIDGQTYYFDSNGVMLTGWTTNASGEIFYFGSDGAMQTGWVAIDGEKFYFADDGIMQARLVTKDGKTYCFDPRGLMQTGWQTLGGCKYYFDSEGAMQTGWVTIDGQTYYFDSNGAMLTGWTTNTSGEKLYFGSDGAMQTGWATIDGKTYYFNSNGVMLTGWTTTAGGEKYYFGSDGVMRTGRQTIDGTEYYFDENGVLQE